LRFLARFAANTIAVYLALYLTDSVAGGRFLLGAVWVAVLLSLVLGFANSLVRPLHRVKAKTVRALVVTLLTLVANALVIQVFAWATPLTAVNLSWVLVAAAFLTLLTGVISYLVGFTLVQKGRPTASTTRVRESRDAAAAMGKKARDARRLREAQGSRHIRPGGR
jgi:uncharacterized membrane protein YvlD (DUF360 family)